MRPISSLLGCFLVCAATSAGATEFSYLGRGPHGDTARVETSDHSVREIRKGEALADVGALTEVTDEEAVFERSLDDGERDALKSVGAAIPDIRRLRLRRALDVTPEDGALFVHDGF